MGVPACTFAQDKDLPQLSKSKSTKVADMVYVGPDQHGKPKRSTGQAKAPTQVCVCVCVCACVCVSVCARMAGWHGLGWGVGCL